MLQQLLLASPSVTVPAIFQLFQEECWGQGDAINTVNETCKLLPLSNSVIVETYAKATASSWIASDLSAATALLMARNCNESRSTSRVERACSKLCKQLMHSLRYIYMTVWMFWSVWRAQTHVATARCSNSAYFRLKICCIGSYHGLLLRSSKILLFATWVGGFLPGPSLMLKDELQGFLISQDCHANFTRESAISYPISLTFAVLPLLFTFACQLHFQLFDCAFGRQSFGSLNSPQPAESALKKQLFLDNSGKAHFRYHSPTRRLECANPIACITVAVVISLDIWNV